mgnify:CR=1 FL=1
MSRQPYRVAEWAALRDRVPAPARVAEVDLVVLRLGEDVAVLYGRCTHRNALLTEGHVEGDKLVCAAHGWDYDCRTGRSQVDAEEQLQPFEAWLDDGGVWVDAAAVARWRQQTPLDFHDDELEW